MDDEMKKKERVLLPTLRNRKGTILSWYLIKQLPIAVNQEANTKKKTKKKKTTAPITKSPSLLQLYWSKSIETIETT